MSEIHRNGRTGYQIDLPQVPQIYAQSGTTHERKFYDPESGMPLLVERVSPTWASDALRLSVAVTMPLGLLSGLVLLASWFSRPPAPETRVQRVEVRCAVEHGWLQSDRVQCPTVILPTTAKESK